MTRMFPFITRTWNPIAGGCEVDEDGIIYACPYKCKYCWARNLINKWPYLKEKYSGSYRLHERSMKSRFKCGDFVFTQDMSDIGAPGIPNSAIIDIFEHIAFNKETKFLLLTKNPLFYRNWRNRIPTNAILGATIETDQVFPNISLAPHGWERILQMIFVAEILPNNKRFVCIEPIMKSSPSFERDILKIRPWAVAVGYDNYKNNLPEPSLSRTEMLIGYLEASGVKVYRKTIREAWDRK